MLLSLVRISNLQVSVEISINFYIFGLQSVSIIKGFHKFFFCFFLDEESLVQRLGNLVYCKLIL